MKALTHQEGQLVRILTGSWDTNSTGPIVVDVVELEAGGVPDHVVGGRVHSALSHRLRHQEEVVSLGQGDHVVYHGPAGGVAGDLAVHLHHPRVDLLVHNDVGELHLVLGQPSLGHAGENGGDLVIDHVLDLTITNAISVDDNSARKMTIKFIVLPKSFGNGWTHVVVELLGGVGVKVGDADVLGHGVVHAGHHGPHRPPLLDGVMIRVLADDHGVSQRHLDGPGFSPQLAVHLDRHLGGHRHQPLGFGQHSRSDNLAGDRLLQTTLLLDCGVMIALVVRNHHHHHLWTDLEQLVQG